jgi:hypothetical protein
MSVFSVLSWCAGIFRYLFEPVSELAYQCRPSVGELTTSSLEMALRLSRQPIDWQKRNAYPGSKQASDEAPSSLLEFLALSIPISSLSLLLVLIVDHELTSLFVSRCKWMPYYARLREYRHPFAPLSLHYNSQVHSSIGSGASNAAGDQEQSNDTTQSQYDKQFSEGQCSQSSHIGYLDDKTYCHYEKPPFIIQYICGTSIVLRGDRNMKVPANFCHRFVI